MNINYKTYNVLKYLIYVELKSVPRPTNNSRLRYALVKGNEMVTGVANYAQLYMGSGNPNSHLHGKHFTILPILKL